eukprot:SAG11_NODE_14985_length_592_cov_1.085193_1_plen_89_part_10
MTQPSATLSPLLAAAALAVLRRVAADGYIFEEVFSNAGASGVCDFEMTNRLCTTDRNGGVTAAEPGTCLGRNDVGELQESTCGLECAQA